MCSDLGSWIFFFVLWMMCEIVLYINWLWGRSSALCSPVSLTFITLPPNGVEFNGCWITQVTITALFCIKYACMMWNNAASHLSGEEMPEVSYEVYHLLSTVYNHNTGIWLENTPFKWFICTDKDSRWDACFFSTAQVGPLVGVKGTP